jgi:hypothetical protein
MMHHCGVQIAEPSIAECGLMIVNWNPQSAIQRNPMATILVVVDDFTNRQVLSTIGIICRLIREKTKLGFFISRSGKLQRVLDACGISKADFDEIEKWLFKES